MGESTCLMQPFCYASGIPNEHNESNPIHALGQSVSFGRFMSESLAWEKWSTFSHNRYVEEAERYSRPGSVAQKKAFFEAHYKKLAAQKAAALLEQANNAASNNNVSQQESPEKVSDNVNNTQEDIQTRSFSNPQHVIDEQQMKTQESDAIVTISDNGCNSNVEANRSGNKTVDGTEKEDKEQCLLRNLVEDVDEKKKVSGNDKDSGTPQGEEPVLKPNSNFDNETLASVIKKKQSMPSSGLLKNRGMSKFPSSPAKFGSLTSALKDNISTPVEKKHARSFADKNISSPTSRNISVNFTPLKELNRWTASVRRKIDDSKASAANSSKVSKDCLTPLKTPTMASKNETQKQSSLTPLTENKRTKTPVEGSASNSKTIGPKWRLFTMENRMRSPIISSPFSLRTEERAARRQKKLEEKFNANEAQKIQLHTKFKEKAETEIRKLRQTFCFKARPLPDFYKERKESNNEIKKAQLKIPKSPKPGRKPALDNMITPSPQGPSINDRMATQCRARSGQSLSCHLSSNSTMGIPHENTSPNIQYGNQNYKYHK